MIINTLYLQQLDHLKLKIKIEIGYYTFFI